MGIDTHTLHLLRYTHKKYGPFSQTVTLGRQAIHLSPRATQNWLGTTKTLGTIYCEKMLKKYFGAEDVDSIDNSDYEGASVIADMNFPLPQSLTRQYDTVLDFGCIEHIFDVAMSLRNITSLCKFGGIILHVLPANGFCGHGFYQFSPELFFSYYSTKNGFDETEIFLARMLDVKHWYKVAPPRDGKRVNIRSSTETFVIVKTKRIASCKLEVQQSDYAHSWANIQQKTRQTAQKKPPRPKLLSNIRKNLMETALAPYVYAVDSAFSERSAKWLSLHPALTKIPVDTLW